MPSLYDPVIPDRPTPAEDDLDRARDLFETAAAPFLRSPWSWAAWGLILPATALATPAAAAPFGGIGVLSLWSLAILLGGGLEIAFIRRAGTGGVSTSLARWALRVQGNLSLIAVALSVLLVWLDRPQSLPAVWLLLLGHSFYSLGGLAFLPLRRSGVVYQVGGLVALWPHGHALEVFALATLIANLWMALAVWRERRDHSAREMS